MPQIQVNREILEVNCGATVAYDAINNAQHHTCRCHRFAKLSTCLESALQSAAQYSAKQSVFIEDPSAQ